MLCVMHVKSLHLGLDDIVLPSSLDHSHVCSMCSQPSHSPKYQIDAPTDNPMIYDANVDLEYEDNVFDVLGGNVAEYVSLEVT